jgi:hypothetical protein
MNLPILAVLSVVWVSWLVSPVRCADLLSATIERADGSTVEAVLEPYDGQGTLRANGKAYPLADVARVTFKDRSALTSSGAEWRFRNGDLLHAAIQAGTEDATTVRACFGDVSLPHDALLGVVFGEPGSVPKNFFSDPLNQDRLLKTNQELVHGFIASISSQALAMEIEGTQRQFPLSEAAAFRFLQIKEVNEPQGLRVNLELLDGSRLSGIWTGGDAEAARLKNGAGDFWVIPWDKVSALEIRGGKRVRLGSLQPSAVNQRALIGGAPMVFGWRVNQDGRGQPLSAQGKEFSHGLYTHAFTRLEFTLDQQFASFQADLGLAMGSPPETVCAWRVEGDGNVLAQGEARAGVEPTSVEVKVDGVKILALVCDFGADNEDAGDHLIWGHAALVRKE